MRPAVPPHAAQLNLNWELLVPSLSEANRAIARFDGILTYLRNPELLMTPLTTREAVLSSKIEGTVVTVGEVLRFEAGDEPFQESKRLDIEEIRNYRTALNSARGALQHRPFCLNLVLHLHKILLTSVRGQNKAPGQFRRVQNHIGRPGSSIEEAEFVPPAPNVLMPALGDWEKYYHEKEKDALVQLAIIHAQFEFLHPFLDGNGRIGRILIPLFLYDKGILSGPTFYLSEYLEENRDLYIAHLRSLGKEPNSWTNWCVFFLNGLTIQADRNVLKVKSILDLYERLKKEMLQQTNSRSTIPLLDAMFAQPIFQAAFFLERRVAQRASLMRQLSTLVDQNILQIIVRGTGRRPTVYSLHELVELCDSNPVKRRPKLRRR